MRRIGVMLLTLGVLSAGGCFGRYEAPLSQKDPFVKIPAMKRAVREKDVTLATQRQLVADLDSDDPAVRLYAIHALEELTGQRMGYEHYLGREERQPALERWRTWLAKQETKQATGQEESEKPSVVKAE